MGTEVGTVEIVGKLDATQIIISLDRVHGKMREFKSDVNSSFASLKRVTDVSQSFAKSLITIGTLGVGAITALATASPALAPELAKMRAEMVMLGNSAGQVLKPVFQELANNVIPSVTEAVNNFAASNFGQKTISVAVESLSDISALFSGDLNAIENLIPKTGLVAAGAAAGFALLGPKGLFIGAALGYAAEGVVVPNISPQESAAIQSSLSGAGLPPEFEETVAATDALKKEFYADDSSNIRVIGGLVKVGANTLFDLLEFAFSKFSRKDQEVAVASATPGSR